MPDPLFRVIIEGELLPGFELELAADNMAKLFKIPPPRAAALISSGKVAIKQDLLEGAARKYMAALKRAGIFASIEAMEPDRAESLPSSDDRANDAQSRELEVLPQQGYILSDDEIPKQPPTPDFKLDHLTIAPQGSDVLEQQYRPAPAPRIDPPDELSLLGISE